MDKLKLSEFDNYFFESELASKSFCTQIISLRCCVKPITNDVGYVVYMQPQPVIVKRFIFLEDAINYYNKKLEEYKNLCS